MKNVSLEIVKVSYSGEFNFKATLDMVIYIYSNGFEFVGSNLAGGKIFTASIGSVDSLYIPPYLSTL